MKIIRLTKQNNDEPVFVNADRINYIHKGGDGSHILLGENDSVYTKETPDEIIAKVSVIG